MSVAALPVVVVGGGIAGLSAAWHLHRSGKPVLLMEADDAPGGVIRSRRDGPWLVEGGPNTLLEEDGLAGAVVKGVGLGARCIEAAPAARHRYVVRTGRLVRAPLSPLSFLTTPLLTWRAKASVLAEPFRPRGDGKDESVADFVRRRLGREFLDYAVNPMVAGIYAGDPERLSVQYAFPRLARLEREHGSLLRGAVARRNTTGAPRSRIVSFPEGLGELPRALAAALPPGSLRTRTAVTALDPLPGGWDVVLAGGERLRSSRVIVALPPRALARLHVAGIQPFSSFAEVHHPPLVCVFLGYRRDAITHPLDGFGFLVPEVEGRRILGTLFSSTLFPARAPEGHCALTTFVGGTRQPDLATLGDSALVDLVHGELTALLGTRARPVFAHITRWPHAIPQYELNHGSRLAQAAAAEAAHPGLRVIGSAVDGVSLAKCLASGARAV